MTITAEKVGVDLCGARNRSGNKTCRLQAGWGTPHFGVGRCKLHGGSTPTHVKAAEQQVAEQVVKALNLTTLPNVAPGQALLNEVNRCQAVVDHISERIEHLEYDDIAGLMVSKITDANGVERTVGANVWVKLLGEWSDRLTRTSKAVMDAGVAERQTRIMEAQASAFAKVMFGIIKELGIDPGADGTIAVVRRHMLDLDIIEVAS